jgi:Ulp1 family protease
MTSQVPSQVFASLSEAWKTAIERLFREGDPKHEWPVISYYGEALTSRTLIRDLAPNQWVSDDVLNGYTKILKDTFNQHPVRQFACFNTQFLVQFNAKSEHIRWQAFTNGVDGLNLQSFHLIFVPVHQNGNHWSVVVIDPMKCATVQFDSLIHSRRALIAEGSAALGDLDRWTKMMFGPAAEGWTYRVARNTIEQPNSSDCGICVLMTIRLLMGGRMDLIERKVASETMQLLADMRVRIAAELMAGKINPSDGEIPLEEGKGA